MALVRDTQGERVLQLDSMIIYDAGGRVLGHVSDAQVRSSAGTPLAQVADEVIFRPDGVAMAVVEQAMIFDVHGQRLGEVVGDDPRERLLAAAAWTALCARSWGDAA